MKPSERIDALAQKIIDSGEPVRSGELMMVSAVMAYLDELHALNERRRHVLRALALVAIGDNSEAREELKKAGVYAMLHSTRDVYMATKFVLYAAEEAGLL